MIKTIPMPPSMNISSKTMNTSLIIPSAAIPMSYSNHFTITDIPKNNNKLTKFNTKNMKNKPKIKTEQNKNNNNNQRKKPKLRNNDNKWTLEETKNNLTVKHVLNLLSLTYFYEQNKKQTFITKSKIIKQSSIYELFNSQSYLSYMITYVLKYYLLMKYKLEITNLNELWERLILRQTNMTLNSIKTKIMEIQVKENGVNKKNYFHINDLPKLLQNEQLIQFNKEQQNLTNKYFKKK